MRLTLPAPIAAEMIAVLNAELAPITDLVASGSPGVGVGYYSRDLDAILTYGPSAAFGHTVGLSITDSHKGKEVMALGTPIVQTGTLVRGDIMNCMWPIERDGRVIGYIWANETVDMVHRQIEPVKNRILAVFLLVLVVVYLSVVGSTGRIIEAVSHIREGIDRLVADPEHHIEPVRGRLNGIVTKINDVFASADSLRVHNQHILDSVTSAIVALSPEGAVTFFNQPAAALVHGEHGVVGTHYRHVFTGPLARLVEETVTDRLLCRSREVHASGRTLDAYSNVITDDAGHEIGFLFVFRDVTLLRNYERQLQEREHNAALAELSLRVVHEVKNPITSIKGFAQLLATPGLTEEKKGRYLSVVDTELNRVNHLLEELPPLRRQGHAQPRAV